MKKIGTRGKANIEANKKIREYGEATCMPNRCEMRLQGCLGSMYLTIAHRKKRNAYKGTHAEIVKQLSDPNEWVLACVNCHNLQEHNKELTEELFNKLRPC